MLKPKVGETWRDRSGHEVKIVMFLAGKSHPNVGVDYRKILHKYTRDGLYIGVGIEHPMDLIERIE